MDSEKVPPCRRQPRTRRRERLRAAIIDAGVLIAPAEGLHALSYARVAKSVDLTASALTTYFPSIAHLKAGVALAAYARLENAAGVERRQYAMIIVEALADPNVRALVHMQIEGKSCLSIIAQQVTPIFLEALNTDPSSHRAP